uniref:Secreted protein n=1 Tax=Haemonchus placei TaxID=6290 RepID=A0A0N4VSP2_HAEPC
MVSHGDSQVRFCRFYGWPPRTNDFASIAGLSLFPVRLLSIVRTLASCSASQTTTYGVVRSCSSTLVESSAATAPSSPSRLNDLGHHLSSSDKHRRC